MSHFSKKANHENLDCFKGNHMQKLGREMGLGGGGTAKMNLLKCLLVMSDPIITILKTLPHKVESDCE